MSTGTSFGGTGTYTVQKVERIPVRDDARRQGKENPNDFGWAFITILIEYHRTVVNA